jgi:hypothetical protein
MGGFTGLYSVVPPPGNIAAPEAIQTLRIPPPPRFQLPEAPEVPRGIGWAGRGTQIAAGIHSLLQGFLAGRAAAEQNMWQRELMINQMFHEQLTSLQQQYAQLVNEPPSPERDQKLAHLRSQMSAVWNARLDRWEALLDKMEPKGRKAGAQPRGRGKAAGPLGTLGHLLVAPVQAVGRGMAAATRLQVPIFIPDRSTIQILRQIGPPLPEPDPFLQLQRQRMEQELQIGAERLEGLRLQRQIAQKDAQIKAQVYDLFNQAADKIATDPEGARKLLERAIILSGDPRGLESIRGRTQFVQAPGADGQWYILQISADPLTDKVSITKNPTGIRVPHEPGPADYARAEFELRVNRLANMFMAQGYPPNQAQSMAYAMALGVFQPPEEREIQRANSSIAKVLDDMRKSDQNFAKILASLPKDQLGKLGISISPSGMLSLNPSNVDPRYMSYYNVIYGRVISSLIESGVPAARAPFVATWISFYDPSSMYQYYAPYTAPQAGQIGGAAGSPYWDVPGLGPVKPVDQSALQPNRWYIEVTSGGRVLTYLDPMGRIEDENTATQFNRLFERVNTPDMSFRVFRKK